jgi:hypothetical protein
MGYSGIAPETGPAARRFGPRPPIIRSIGTEMIAFRPNCASLRGSSHRDGANGGCCIPSGPGDQDILELQDALEVPRGLSAVAEESAPEMSGCTEPPNAASVADEDGGRGGISESSSSFWSLENELLHCEVARLRNKLLLYARGRLIQEATRIIGELGGWTDPEPFEAALWRAIEGDQDVARELQLSPAESMFLRELRDDSAGWILLTDPGVPTFVDLDSWATTCPGSV